MNRKINWWGDHFTSELISTPALTPSRSGNSSQNMFYQTIKFNYSCYDCLVNREKHSKFTYQAGATYLLKNKPCSWVTDYFFCCLLFNFHRITWIGRDLRYHLSSSLLPLTRILFTWPDSSELHPAWSWIPGIICKCIEMNFEYFIMVSI